MRDDAVRDASNDGAERSGDRGARGGDAAIRDRVADGAEADPVVHLPGEGDDGGATEALDVEGTPLENLGGNSSAGDGRELDVPTRAERFSALRDALRSGRFDDLLPRPIEGRPALPDDFEGPLPGPIDLRPDLPDDFEGPLPGPIDLRPDLPDDFEGPLPGPIDLRPDLPDDFEGPLPGPIDAGPYDDIISVPDEERIPIRPLYPVDLPSFSFGNPPVAPDLPMPAEDFFGGIDKPAIDVTPAPAADGTSAPAVDVTPAPAVDTPVVDAPVADVTPVADADTPPEADAPEPVIIDPMGLINDPAAQIVELDDGTSMVLLLEDDSVPRASVQGPRAAPGGRASGGSY